MGAASLVRKALQELAWIAPGEQATWGVRSCDRSHGLAMPRIGAVAEAVGMWAKASISPRSIDALCPTHRTRGKRSRSAKRIVHISTAFFDAHS